MPAEAIVVNTRRRAPGQMLGMGDAVDVLDSVTGGEVSSAIAQLNRLEILLKVSIAASVIAGLAGLVAITRERT